METRNVVISTLREYEVRDDLRSWRMFSFTVLCHLFLVFASAYCYTIHPWLSTLFWVPIAFFLCRFFVIEHDCGHFSFFTKRSHNSFAGTILGFFTMIPSTLWNHIHNVHHGLVGNLSERRTNPELWTMTVKEYQRSSVFKKLAYRFMRSYFMRLLVTPALWILAPRIPMPHLGWKILTSVIVHNIIYGFILYFIIVNSYFLAFAMVYLVPLYMFNFLASVLFYVQHQYEDTSWEDKEEWDLYKASIEGSSYLKTGKLMGWVSGNVGCHHVHHLNTKIPSYNLPNATDDVNRHLDIVPIYLKELFHHLDCVLWDEESRKLISFKAYRKMK